MPLPSAGDAAPTTEIAAGAQAPAGKAAAVQEAKNNQAVTASDMAADAAKDDEPAKPESDDTNGIAATVNDESISDYEVRQRVALGHGVELHARAGAADAHQHLRARCAVRARMPTCVCVCVRVACE